MCTGEISEKNEGRFYTRYSIKNALFQKFKK